jgi:hypothetical protein
MLKFIQTKIFLIILSSLFYTVGISQVLDTEFNGYLSPVAQTGGSAPNFNFQAIYRNDNLDIMGFDTTGFIGNVHIVATNDGKCYKLPLVSLNTPSSNLNAGELISGTVNDPSGELVTLPPGVLAIYKETSNSQLRPYISSLPDELKSCMITLNMITLDNAGSNLPQVSDTYYVSTYGNDSTAKQGFINLPYDNIKKAIDSADGARVHMLEGKWLITATEDSVENADIILNTTSLNLDVDNVDLVSDGDIIVDYDTSTTISDVRLFSSGIGENKVVKFKAPKLQILNKGSQVIRAFNMEGNSKLYVDIDSFSIVKPQLGYSAAIFVGEESIVRLGTVKWGTQDFYNIFNADRDVKKTHYLEIDDFQTLGVGGATNSADKRAFLLSGRGSLSTGTDSINSNIILHNVDNDSMTLLQTFYRISESGRDINNSTFNLDIGNMTSRMKMEQDTYSYNGFNLFQYLGDFEFNRGTLRGSNVNINIDNYRTNVGAAFYFYGYTLDSTSFNINLGNAEFFNGPLLSDRTTGTTNIRNNSVISVHCDNCEFRDNSILLDVRSTFVVSSDSRLQFSGNYKVYGAGLPAIYSASDIYLNNCTLENDGVSNIIDSPVPITVYVSGAWNASNSPIGSNVTIVKLDEFGEPQLSDTYFIAPYGSDVTGKIGKRDRPFASINQPYVNGKKYIQTELGNYTTDETLIGEGYTNIKINGSLTSRRSLVNIPFGSSGSTVRFEADSLYVMPTSFSTGSGIFMPDVNDLYFDVRYFDGSLSPFASFGDETLGGFYLGKGNANINIGTMRSVFNSTFIFKNYNTDKNTININIDNFMQLEEPYIPFGGSQQNVFDFNIANSDIAININSMNLDSFGLFNAYAFKFEEVEDINATINIKNLSVGFNNNGAYTYPHNPFISDIGNLRIAFLHFSNNETIANSDIIFNLGQVKYDHVAFIHASGNNGDAILENSDLTFNIDQFYGTDCQLLGNELLNPISGIELINSNLNINCKNCEFADSAMIGQITKYILTGDSKLTFSGKYKVTQAGYPAIFTNTDIYLENCILENDGVTNIIESDSTITVYVSGAWNASNSPIGNNVTIVRLEEFGNTPNKYTSFNTVTSTPATVDVAPNQFTIIDATSGVITYSFTSTNMNVGDRILLKCLNGNTNTITLDPDGATQLFDDSAVNTIDITTAREDLELVWTGTVWNIIR